MLTEKEKFEEELKLLEESYVIDVITKNEYEDAKKRIDAKLKRLEQKEETKVEEDDVKAEEKAEETGAEREEIKKKAGGGDKEKKIVEKDIGFETYDNEIIEEKEGAGYGPSEEAGPEEGYAKEEEKEKEKEITDITKRWEGPEEEKKPESVLREEIQSSKKIYAYAVIMLILAAISSYLFFFSGQNNPNTIDKPLDKPISLIACNSDKDCTKEGAIGVCKNAGKENSKCSFIEDAKVKLTILNIDKCFNCETGRVLSILTGLFPNLEIENVDFETEEGKETAEKFLVAALPAYILNSSLKETRNYDKFSNAFNEISENFVMKYTVSNANYYTERQEIPNKLDLFVKPGQAASSKAEENIKEFLKAFDGKVIFEKHNEGARIIDELGINTFPSFIVNNKIKFSGVQPASKIRENFCIMNNLPECSLELSKSLI